MSFPPESREARLLDVLTELRRFTGRIRREWNDKIPEVTFSESVLLNMVGRGDCVTAGDIAAELGIDKSTASRHISSLESRGHIYREGIEGERRAQALHITESGRSVLARIDRVRLETIARRVDGWTTDEVETFHRLLARFNED